MRRICFLGMAFVIAGMVAGIFAGERVATRGAGELREWMVVGGVKRSYLVHVPKGWDEKTKMAMVMCLHGATDNAEYAREAYGWCELADKEGFVAVFPDGLGNGEVDDGKHYWEVEFGENGRETEDGKFLVRVIGAVAKNHAVDAGKVFVCGHSNGAMMTYALVMRHPELVAGAGVVAGTVGTVDGKGKVRMVGEGKGAVPMVIVHGMKDANLAYATDVAATQGSGVLGGAMSSVTLGVKESVAYWVKVNGCEETAKREESADGEVVREFFGVKEKGKGAAVEVVTVVKGNHMWPGGKEMAGKTQKPSKVVDATREMWGFWKREGREKVEVQK